jgi:hypothetical protein
MVDETANRHGRWNMAGCLAAQRAHCNIQYSGASQTGETPVPLTGMT